MYIVKKEFENFEIHHIFFYKCRFNIIVYLKKLKLIRFKIPNIIIYYKIP